jgi:hypothetical protein
MDDAKMADGFGRSATVKREKHLEKPSFKGETMSSEQ